MEYIPREPDHSVNVSKEHPLVEASTLVIGLGIIFALIAVFLLFVVEVVLYFVPAEREAALFNAWLPEDIVTVAYDDQRLLRAEGITNRLARHYPDSPYTFRVEIDDSPDPNAMAFPGGLIVLTSGLLDAVESENELAFIIGHEIGHFHNRDHLRALGRGLVLSLYFMTISGNDSTSYGASVAGLTVRSFNRRQESAADDFGLGLVQAEYGHVNDSWRFFQRLDARDGGLEDLYAYFSTHPSADDRIEEMMVTAGENGWSTTGDVTPIDWPD